MKSRTSFFNLAVLRKDITRFSPVWSLYTIFMLLILFGMSGTKAAMASDMLDLMKGMAWVNLFYAGVCAVCLFGDLFNGRLCNGLHAFPLRRESWLVTHSVVGVLFSLIPNLLVSVLACGVVWDFAYIPFIWLAGSMLQFLFFFGTAVLSAVCVGNRIGMVAVYGIIHFITVLVYAVAVQLYEPLLYGIRMDNDAFFRFFPLMRLSGVDYADFYVRYEDKVYGHFRGLIPESWAYLGICAGVGLVCVGLAWLVYRRRQLEDAGDFISLGWLRPVFMVIFTVGAGTLLYLFSDLFNSPTYVCLAVGLAIGYFAGRMLLCRTLKVFNKRSFLGFAAIVVLLVGSMCLTWLDPLGITRHTPDTDEIEWAAVLEGNTYYSYDLFYGYDKTDAQYRITDPEEVKAITELHTKLADKRIAKDMADCTVKIQYALKNGRRVTRFYPVVSDSDLGKQVQMYLSDMRYLFRVYDPEHLYGMVDVVTVDRMDKSDSEKLTDRELIAGLLDAVAADCAEGNMVQHWAWHENADIVYLLHFEYNDYGDMPTVENFYYMHSSSRMYAWTNSSHTVAYLKSVLPTSAEGDQS